MAKSGKFPDATAELEKAAQLEPANSCKYYYNLGALYTNAGQVDPALDTFKKAITADPNCADAYYQTGINLMAKVTTTPDGKMIPVPGTVGSISEIFSPQTGWAVCAIREGHADHARFHGGQYLQEPQRSACEEKEGRLITTGAGLLVCADV